MNDADDVISMFLDALTGVAKDRNSVGARLQELEQENAKLQALLDRSQSALFEANTRLVPAEQRANERSRELAAAWNAVPSDLLPGGADPRDLADIIAALVEQANLTASNLRDAQQQLHDIAGALGQHALDSDAEDLTPTVEWVMTQWEKARQELTDLRVIHHDYVNQNRPKPVGLGETLQRINDVVTQQIEALSPTSGTAKTVDIRRRMLAKYPIAHDVGHLDDNTLLTAARSLLFVNPAMWPWDDEDFHAILGSGDTYLHAAALLIAQYDAAKASRGAA